VNAKIRRAGIIAVALLVACLLEVTLLSRLGIPGATPDLVVVTVVAIAFAYGPATGAVAGFSAGMLLGLTPPATGSLGAAAVVYLTIGLVSSLSVDPRDRSVPVILGVCGLSCVAAVMAMAMLTSLLGASRVNWGQVPIMMITTFIYGVILAPMVVPPIISLAKKFTPELIEV